MGEMEEAEEDGVLWRLTQTELTARYHPHLASFPGLYHSFCRLQYENRGECLEGFCT